VRLTRGGLDGRNSIRGKQGRKEQICLDKKRFVERIEGGRNKKEEALSSVKGMKETVKKIVGVFQGKNRDAQ